MSQALSKQPGNSDNDWIVDVYERDNLDEQHRQNFTKPWICIWPDGAVEEYDTEDEAFDRQIAVGREAIEE